LKLNTQEYLQQGQALRPSPIPVADLIGAAWQRRRTIMKLTAGGAVLTLGIVFLLPNEYISSAQLMPPEQQSVSSMSSLSALSGAGLMVAGAGASLLNQRTPGATAIGVLTSRTAQDDIIKRFDLLKVYGDDYYFDARKTLTRRSTFSEDKKSGIITITVMDHNRQRAHDMTQAYVEELDKLGNSISTSSARREREFLESRLKDVKASLDVSAHALSDFSSRNATLDMEKQGEATVEAAGKLEAELVVAESDLSALKATYTEDNARVRQMRGRVDELQRQVRKAGGMGEKPDDEELASDQMIPSIRKLPILGLKYYDLYRQVTTEETVYELLSKQYEMARVQEAKEIPTVKVLDAPDLPEWKSSPHRAVLVLLGTFLSFFGSVAWIVTEKLRGGTNRVQFARVVATGILHHLHGFITAEAE